MNLDTWATRWAVPPQALAELRALMIAPMPPLDAPSGGKGSETRQQGLVRLDADAHGVWLSRNNVGALLDARGVPVRYGLANESKAQNKAVKSGDLIGIKPVLILQEYVGRTIGQFVSREVKHEAWKWCGDEHEVAQMNWVKFVLAKGGDAAFCSGPGSFK